MPPIDTSMNMLVQSSTDISDRATHNSPDNPLNEMSPRSDATAGTATQPEAPFRFMDLPAELRNNIYRHYFSELPKLKFINWSVWPEAGAEFLSILHSSRQVRREAAPIFYQEYIGNAGDEDENPWSFASCNVLGMLKTLLAISQQLKEYSPDTRVRIECHLDDEGSNMWVIANAIRELSGVQDGPNALSNSGRFAVGHWTEYFADSESLMLRGPVGQIDWSSLLGLYEPHMEGSGTVVV